MIVQNDRERPKKYIERAIKILKSNASKHDIDVVELGCMRFHLLHDIEDTAPWQSNDGYSSYLWARAGLKVESVDISESCVQTAREECAKFPNIKFFNMDAFDYLRQILLARYKKLNIGLLYLDAWDIEEKDCADKHLQFYNVIKHFLNENCLILIDDTDLYWDFDKNDFYPDESGLSGKGKLVIPQAISDGYKVIFKGRQTMLSKVEINE